MRSTLDRAHVWLNGEPRLDGRERAARGGRPRRAVPGRDFGEGASAESERAIQTLLGADEPLSEVDADGLAAPADWAALNSPETWRATIGR